MIVEMMKVEGGEPGTDDYDTGTVLDIDAENNMALVAWSCGVRTWTPIDLLDPRK